MTVKVGHLFKKRTIRNLDGSIRLLQDDTMGGTIVRNGQVINEEAMKVLVAKEEDRKTAAQALTVSYDAPEEVRETRTATPSKIQELENRITAQDSKLDAILAALKK